MKNIINGAIISSTLFFVISWGFYQPPIVLVSVDKKQEQQQDIVYYVEEEATSEPVIELFEPSKPIEYKSHYGIISPIEIPMTFPQWTYNGTNLKWHISVEHGISYQRMINLGPKDLIKLHSFLHNGGSL